MNLVYLTPNSDGNAQVALQIFTKSQLGKAKKGSKYANTLHPCRVNVLISASGVYDLDVIADVVKEKYDPQTKRWRTKNGARPLFVALSSSKLQELREKGVELPDATTTAGPVKKKKKVKRSDAGRPITAITINDGLVKKNQPKCVKVLITPITDKKDEAYKIPGFPLAARLDVLDKSDANNPLKVIGESGGRTGKFATTEVGRFIIGKWYNGHFFPAYLLPVAIEPKLLLQAARHVYGGRSGWIWEPPSMRDFDTTIADLENAKREIADSKIPMEITIFRATNFTYITDSGGYCPEGLNVSFPNNKSGNWDKVKWVSDWDGKTVKVGDVTHGKKFGKKGAYIYSGPGFGIRFAVIDKDVKGKKVFAFNEAMAYLVTIDQYKEVVKKHRPELLKDWDEPTTKDERNLFFLASDWCMRNDANIKRGTVGAQELAPKSTIDLYSRPYHPLSRWITGPFRQKYRDNTRRHLPGIEVYKSSASHVQLEKLITFNAAKDENKYGAVAKALKIPKVPAKKK